MSNVFECVRRKDSAYNLTLALVGQSKGVIVHKSNIHSFALFTLHFQQHQASYTHPKPYQKLRSGQLHITMEIVIQSSR